MFDSYESQLVALISNNVYPKTTENNLPIPQVIDLKNLCDYEETRLPKWNQLFEDDPEDLFSPSKAKKKEQRPPPGFSALNSTKEDSPEKPTVNPADFTIPNTFSDPNLDLSMFLKTNLFQNSFSNYCVNSPNMFYQNGLNGVNLASNNTSLDATKIQMEIFRLQTQINSFSLMLGQSTSGVANAACAALLHEQMNILTKQFQEMQLFNAQQAAANINLQIPQIQNTASSSQQNTQSPTSSLQFTEAPKEPPKPSNLTTNFRTSQQNSPSSSVHNLNLSPNVSEVNNFESSCNNSAPISSSSSLDKSAQSQIEKVDENRNFWDAEKKLTENSKTSSIEGELSTQFSTNMEQFFKKIPKLSEKSENHRKPEFKDTNPFKADLAANKLKRVKLQSFYDSLPSDLSVDSNIKKNPKTEYFKTSYTDKETSSDFYMFDNRKEVDRSSDFRVETKESLQKPCTPPPHDFAPVVTSSPKKVNKQGLKIVYEAGPVLYNNKETEKTTENSICDRKLWKPIPPAEPSRARESPVSIRAFNFNITKPKSPGEKAKRQINRNILDTKSVEKSSNLSAPDDLNGFITPPNFSLPSSWSNSHILSPGKLSKQSDVSSECLQENYIPTESSSFIHRSPPAKIYTTVTDGKVLHLEKESDNMFRRNQESTLSFDHNLSAEIFTTDADGCHMLKTKFEEEIEENLKTCSNNRDKFDQVEFNLENAGVGNTRSTNPFMEDILLNISQKKTVHDLNEISRNSEPFKFFEPLTESSRIDHDLNGISRNSESLKLFGQVTESIIIETNVEPTPCQNNSLVCLEYQLKSKDKSIFVINLSDEGWLSTDEFVDAFTDLDASSVMLSLLNMMNLTIPFKVIDRVSHPSLLAELDKTQLNVPRDSQNKILRSVHLTPLKSTLRILTKLKVIRREDMNAAISKRIYADGTILSDMMKLISSYGMFMRTKCKN